MVTARQLLLFEGISAAAVTAISFGPTPHRHSNGIWVWTASVGGPLGADDSDSESRDLIFYLSAPGIVEASLSTEYNHTSMEFKIKFLAHAHEA
jgi:hypothetical protein